MPDEIEPYTGGSDNSAPARASASATRVPQVRYRIGGGEYAMYSAPQCYVCQCDQRVAIERALMNGYGAASIARKLEPMDILGKRNVQITGHHISEHVRRQHLPLEQWHRRQLIDQRIEELGHSVEEFEGHAADHMTFMREVARRGYEQLAQGRMAIDAKDALSASKFLAKLDAADTGDGVPYDTVQAAFAEYHGEVDNLLRAIAGGQMSIEHADTRQALSKLLAENPRLKDLDAAFRQQQIDRQQQG